MAINYYDPDFCEDCRVSLPIRVLRSGAGWYIGTFCEQCGPYDRHSMEYWPTREEAQAAHDSGNYSPTF